MKSCEGYEELASACADGALSREDRLRFEAHASGCLECSRKARLARALKAAVGDLPAPAMPRELKEALLAEARRRQAGTSPGWLTRILSPGPAAYGLAAGLAAAAVVVVVRLSQPSSQTLPLDVLLAAHSQYARSMPFADEAVILSDLPQRLSSEAR